MGNKLALSSDAEWLTRKGSSGSFFLPATSVLSACSVHHHSLGLLLRLDSTHAPSASAAQRADPPSEEALTGRCYCTRQHGPPTWLSEHLPLHGHARPTPHCPTLLFPSLLGSSSRVPVPCCCSATGAASSPPIGLEPLSYTIQYQNMYKCWYTGIAHDHFTATEPAS
jgi:hypothetical protein